MWKDLLTSHEIGYIDCIATIFGIFVGKEPTVWKLPPEDIGDEYNYSFLWCPFIWPSHIGWEAVKLDLNSSRLACMDSSTHTVATLNGIHFLLLS
jgi:hypothetical protein